MTPAYKMNITVARRLQKPPPHLVQALSDEFLDSVNAGVVAEIQLIKMENTKFAGYAHIDEAAAARPTVYFNARSFNPVRDGLRPSPERIRTVYLHELAHLISKEGHTLYFAAINCVMHARAGLIDQVKQYDVQDMAKERRASGLHAAVKTAEHFENDNRPIIQMQDEIREKAREFEESIRGAHWAHRAEEKAVTERNMAEHRAWTAILWMRFSILVIAMLWFRLMIS